MRRMLAIFALVAVSALAVAAPAFAQDDPFEPAEGGSSGGSESSGGGPFDPSDGSGTDGGDTGGGDTDGGDTTVDGDGTEDPVRPESLPNTGASSTSWLGVAYGLIVVGAGILVLARLPQPRALRRYTTRR